MIFRHIDAVVEGLLVCKMCQKYSRWHRETVPWKFWITSGGYHIFALPDDPTCRVVRLAPLAMVQHKPCKVSFNPYLDKDYFSLIQHRRDEQKANGKYRAVWQRQGGCCAFCGNPMLADQEVEVVEKVVGKGRRVQNLIYIFDCWTSQGYEIKTLHRIEERVVFRRVVTGVSGVKIPKALTARKLPDAIVYKLEKLLKQFVRDNGL